MEGAKAHTARASMQFLRQPTSDFIEPEDWPSKSPDISWINAFGACY